MGYKGQFSGKKKPRGWKKITLIVVSVLLVLIIGVVGAGVAYWYSTIGKIGQADATDNTMTPEQQSEALQEIQQEFGYENPVDITEPTDPLVEDPEEYISKTPNIINIMLIGQDSRGKTNYKLSDSMILCTINREEKTLVMTSFLRDMYVKLPNYDGKSYGYNRINAAYSYGWLFHGSTKSAMEMLDQCLLENFGVQVDYNVEVDFEAFKQIVDLMGGVDIELTSSEANHLNSNNGGTWFLSAGVNRLNGEQALAYARIRKLDGDFQRTNRQRKVISAMLDKCRTMSLLELNDLLQTVLPLVTTDMGSDEITAYALDLLPLLVDLQVTSQAIPQEGSYYFANKGTEEQPMSVIIPDLEESREYLRQTIGG